MWAIAMFENMRMSYRRTLLLLAAAFILNSVEVTAADTRVVRTGPVYTTSCFLLLCSVEEVVGIVIGSKQYGVPDIVEGAIVRGDGRCRAGPGAFMEDSVIVKNRNGEVSSMSADSFVFNCRAD